MNSLFFHHPGQGNCMEDDASRLFNLSDTKFITHMSVGYPHPHGLWNPPPPPLELLSCMIFTLRRKPCKQAILRMRDSRGYIGSGLNSVPPYWSILLSKIHPPFTSNSSKSTATGSITPGTLSAGWTDLGNNQFLRHGGRLQQPTSWMACLNP